MKTFKKTFYFKNHNTVAFTMESNATIDCLKKYYYKRLRKGKIIIEKVGDEKEIIIDLRSVDIIEIKEEKENENETHL